MFTAYVTLRGPRKLGLAALDELRRLKLEDGTDFDPRGCVSVQLTEAEARRFPNHFGECASVHANFPAAELVPGDVVLARGCVEWSPNLGAGRLKEIALRSLGG